MVTNEKRICTKLVCCSVVLEDASFVSFTRLGIEKQPIIEIVPKSRQLVQNQTQKQLEENTREILEKIALVNERHGLNKKKPKPAYQQFPFSYLKSQESHGRQNSDFKFPREPFSNPILDYIEQKNNRFGTRRQPTGEYGTEVSDDSINDEDEEEIPGQYIKRKITHKQTIFTPLPGYFPGNLNLGQQQLQSSRPQYFYPPSNVNDNIFIRDKGDLEKLTIDNVKNIVGTSAIGFNPYAQPVINPYGYPQHIATEPVSNSYRLYGPYFSDEIFRPSRQQWQWPLGNYFPIVIKDPFIHMMNAVTTMIEYGPQAHGGSACANKNKEKGKLTNTISENETDKIASTGRKLPDSTKLSYNIINNGKGAEITVLNEDDSNLTTLVDIEDLRISDKAEDPIQFDVNYRQSKQNREIEKKFIINTSKSTPNGPLLQSLHVSKKQNNSRTGTNRQSPPIRDQILHDDELYPEDESLEKAEDVTVSHDGNKKLFSKDNTGSGIFVHKIKVRKGGVAIAGPGGIATAGSGGTAIVGPNGFAYTHPDSLAIAGSGTKVVAVEPTINLFDVVSNTTDNTHKNKTRGQGHAPRIGKVVAIGPVIYYNKG